MIEGYTESTTICDEVIILSVCGTAAIINMDMTSPLPHHVSHHTTLGTIVSDPNTSSSNSGERNAKSGCYTTLHLDLVWIVIGWLCLLVDKAETSKKLRVDVNLANESVRSNPDYGERSGSVTSNQTYLHNTHWFHYRICMRRLIVRGLYDVCFQWQCPASLQHHSRSLQRQFTSVSGRAE